MPVRQLPSAPRADSLFSLDAYLQLLRSHGKDVLVIRAAKGIDHTNINGGDVLVVERCGNCPKCHDRTWMVVMRHGKYIIEQKRRLGALLQRSRLHIVGAATVTALEPIGRVLAWVPSLD